MDTTMAGRFIMKLFDARTRAHILHLQSRSFAEHTALDGFYTALVPLADRIAESFQGKYGLIADYPEDEDAEEGAEGACAFLEALGGWVEANREELAPDSDIQNLVDEVVSLIDSTFYKCKYLK